MFVPDQPRERLLRVAAGALSDAELVALVAVIEVQGATTLRWARS